MAELCKCPGCGADVTEDVLMYVSTPSRSYKSSEAQRKASLKYYYRNRARVLAKMKDQRKLTQEALKAMAAAGI